MPERCPAGALSRLKNVFETIAKADAGWNGKKSGFPQTMNFSSIFHKSAQIEIRRIFIKRLMELID
jgi:hypothetical protein